ncbi:MAG TPA: CPBP family intramembrane metalloprotease [Anaerolineaceae bacterium]|nr:CPBP family intramembrane metalloprotease [Anaerolineaceae bacterium]
MLSHLAAWLSLAAFLSLAVPSVRRRGEAWVQRTGWPSVLLLLLPYLLVAGLSAPVADILRVLAYLLVPTAIVHWAQPRGKASWGALLAGLTIWFPLEPELFLLSWGGKVAGPWHWFMLPEVSAPLAGDLSLPIAKMTGVLLALYLFLLYRPLEGIGYTARLTRRDGSLALRGLGMFMVAGVPVGFALRFLTWVPHWPGLGQALPALLAIYLFTGIPEELLFRGVFQNAFRRWFGEEGGLVVAAVVFGLSHLDNATPGHPVPNAAYALMATLAGLAYGWVWRRSGKITAAALTHALVDWLWWLLFGG